MFILLLLFFKSICLYCQRLVLHIHDRWINPKNSRLLTEVAETKGTKFAIEEFRHDKKTKKRRNASSATSSSLSHCLADSENCRFCANTPQGYCRHHFHLQELQLQKQQHQKIWCPLSGGTNRSTERRQLRKIKRELKQNIQQQQSAKASYNPGIYDYSYTSTSSYTGQHQHHSPPPSYESNSVNSFNDSGYQSVSVVTNTSSNLESENNSGVVLLTTPLEQQPSELTSIVSSSGDYVEIELPSPAGASVVETTYSFETCCESSSRSSSPVPRTNSFNSFMSCEYSAISTSYL